MYIIHMYYVYMYKYIYIPRVVLIQSLLCPKARDCESFDELILSDGPML